METWLADLIHSGTGAKVWTDATGGAVERLSVDAAIVSSIVELITTGVGMLVGLTPGGMIQEGIR